VTEETFRLAKAQQDMKTRVALGLPVAATVEELAAQAVAEDDAFRAAKGMFDAGAKHYMENAGQGTA
jgi:hypothetical protein